MKDEKFRKALNKYLMDWDDEAILFENPSFDGSIIGLTTDRRLVYDYDQMVEELAIDENMELIEAEDFISSDTLWALSNMGDKKPIVVELKKIS